MVRRRHADLIDRAHRAAAGVELPPAVFKTCPWEPRELIDIGLRQWLRCCAPALRDGQVIGMPSRAVDEAWHGFILCTARYSAFCDEAYGRFLHHHPEGAALAGAVGAGDPVEDQVGRTVLAWSLVAAPGERCVLWDLDHVLGVEDPWGIEHDRVAAIEMSARKLIDRSRRQSHIA
ncbi:hypothetical protein FK535_18705 [Mycolicibacterium sp. 018/SC-01/001]|uniref:hypothetical protein n=1 Tax=Mycolicibacterium sp. 018/SC-01/001 TaxID=2592069 RepID=UPI00117D5940|nr:hypothetical protein [Mycolicibacterium sp. 018/SC-01/001]TRW80731.1 hypothetical protein FK535_18705 [Mycolicibacterium sp. 018/SC-01/001]